MTNIAKKISWLTPLALLVSLPASAISMSITETIDNPGFKITDQFVEVEEGIATEFEILETWKNTAHPSVHKLITIDYATEIPYENPFELEFKVTNATPRDWSGYSFTFSGLGGLALGDVLVDWENELEDDDALGAVFHNSAIVGDTLRFGDGAHPSGSMVSYELFFDLDALAQAEITEIGVVQAVPLPAAAWLMIGGLGMLVGFAKKRKTA